MSGEGGLSVSDVRRIVDSEVAPLRHDVAVLDRRMDRLEAEMANVEGAIERMHGSLARELGSINQRNTEMVQLQQTTQKITLEQFVAANVQLGAANVGLHSLNSTSETGFATLDAGIGRMAQAIVQTEVIRLLHEAKEPVDRANQFGNEIEQRFAKAVENVYFVRSQYDQLQVTAMTEYEKKLRVIGEHIYRIRDEEFLPAEERLTDPTIRTVELPMAMDERRLKLRGEALDDRFASLGDEFIEPLLSAHRQVEHLLASRFTTEAKVVVGREVALPVAVRIGPGGLEVLGSVAPTALDCGETTELAFETCGNGAARDAVVSKGDALLGRLQTAELGDEHKSAFIDALRRLATDGRIDPALLPGFEEYLQRFGLSVIASQEVTES